MKKIAIYLKNREELCPFSESDSVQIYEKNDGAWAAGGRFDYKLDLGSLVNLRKSVSKIADSLKEADCNVISGKNLSGAAYTVFDTAGFHIFDIESCDESVFDGVFSEIETAAASAVSVTPRETETPGVFFLDLVELQREKPEITSKMALKNFLDTEIFSELSLVCAHVPPWIINDGRFDIKSSNSNNNVLAVITKKQCED